MSASNTLNDHLGELRRIRRRRERWHDAWAALSLAALVALIFWLLPASAQARRFDCGQVGGIERLRCERHEKMFAKGGPTEGEAHFACTREFLRYVRDTMTASPMGPQ